MKSGIPLQRPAFAVNRLCGSGFQAIVSGAQVGSEFYNNFLKIFNKKYKGRIKYQYNVKFYREVNAENI